MPDALSEPQGPDSGPAAAALLTRSSIEAVIPNDPEQETLSLLVDDDQEDDEESAGRSRISSVPQRQLLYLDELVPVHIVLKVPFVAEQDFKTWLSRLSVRIEANALGVRPAEPNQNQSDQPKQPENIKELVDSCVVDADNDPLVAVGSETPAGASKTGDDDAEPEASAEQSFIYVLWKEELHISRPRVRAAASSDPSHPPPSIYLSATASLRPAPSPSSGAPTSTTAHPTLHTNQTASPNLLSPLALDPSFKSNPPVLTASRLAKHAPAGFLSSAPPRPIKNAVRPLIPVAPALRTRLRLLRAGSAQRGARILASIDIEAAVTLGKSTALHIESVDAKLPTGHAEPLSPPKLPTTLRSGDVLCLVWTLEPSQDPRRHNAPGADTDVGLTFRLSASAHPLSASGADGTVHRALLTTWRAALDMDAAMASDGHGASHVAVSSGAPARRHAPTRSGGSLSSASSPGAGNGAGDTEHSARTKRSVATPALTLTLETPKTHVRPGSEVAWRTQISRRPHHASQPQSQAQSQSQSSLEQNHKHTNPPPNQPPQQSAEQNALRITLRPHLHASDAHALTPQTPSVAFPVLAPGGAASIPLVLRAPVREGWARFAGVDVVVEGEERTRDGDAALDEEGGGKGEGSARKRKVWTVPGWMAPDVLVTSSMTALQNANGRDGADEEDGNESSEDSAAGAYVDASND